MTDTAHYCAGKTVLITGGTGTQRANRVGFSGGYEDGLQSDWTMGAYSRN